jgi:uncharacterized membrane protein
MAGNSNVGSPLLTWRDLPVHCHELFVAGLFNCFLSLLGASGVRQKPNGCRLIWLPGISKKVIFIPEALFICTNFLHKTRQMLFTCSQLMHPFNAVYEVRVVGVDSSAVYVSPRITTAD